MVQRRGGLTNSPLGPHVAHAAAQAPHLPLLLAGGEAGPQDDVRDGPAARPERHGGPVLREEVPEAVVRHERQGAPADVDGRAGEEAPGTGGRERRRDVPDGRGGGGGGGGHQPGAVEHGQHADGAAIGGGGRREASQLGVESAVAEVSPGRVGAAIGYLVAGGGAGPGVEGGGSGAGLGAAGRRHVGSVNAAVRCRRAWAECVSGMQG
ncbi:hypothetical protein UVI_02041930 [Ustilaginoidea virens]|uniref:Uncharacterized protein n=1 Tax=Ustilaginoidea virens TaxID=1159556 RepID=A0A1B5L7H2_USTVR|nr:hypothetical protein UVI_02041930 [Ustilaginoidea virens]